jgi:polyphosphate glucokinase
MCTAYLLLQVPNLELGHIEMDGEVAEKLASAAAREREELGWKKWAGRVNQYLGKLERLLSPDLIVRHRRLFWSC